MKLPIVPLSLPQATQTEISPRQNSEGRALAKACQDFEAVFLKELFKGMRSTAIDGGLFEKGNDQEIFREMLDLEVAKSAAAQNTLGIGQVLLKKLQEPEG